MSIIENRRLKLLTSAIAAILLWSGTACAETQLTPFDIDVQSRVISTFQAGEPTKKVFGKLEYIGGLELFSDNDHFGGYSGLRLLDDENFLAISDIGFWLKGTLQRENGRLSAITNTVAAPILDKDGKQLTGKTRADAEGIELVGSQVVLSFERDHRIEARTLDSETFTGSVTALAPQTGRVGLRGNKGLEAIVFVPPVPARSGEAANFKTGRFLLFSERSLNSVGNLRAFILENGKLEEFAVSRKNRFDVTAADIGPDGQLYLLERRYSIADGVAMRIRRFDLDDVKPGKTIRGETLIRANTNHQIDNFEGLSIRRSADGDTILTLLSDDNYYILQRTLLLEFKLLD